MPNFNDILTEFNRSGSTFDVVRRRHLERLAELTGRNVILYYSGWLQKQVNKDNQNTFAINDADKNGFMAVIHQLDKSKGLDLVLHTPGGGTAATESLVDYLHAMFGNDIRAVVPQIAMSAGTMIACACKEILMGKHSSLGPIDPQLGGVPAHGVIEEFTKAAEEIKNDQSKAFVWQPIIAKYTPTFIGECQKSINWSNTMVKQWLMRNMFSAHADAETRADRVIGELADHALTMSHDRHISMDRARALGLNVVALEDDNDLQDAVLSVHHACVLTLGGTPALKITENHKGIAFVIQAGP